MTTTATHTIVHRDAIERAYGYELVRRALGVRSFGINIQDLRPGEEGKEHEETARDQEEVFFAVSGSPSIVIDGEEHPLPDGTFARLDPERRRALVNRAQEPASVLIVSAPRTSGYEPMDWA